MRIEKVTTKHLIFIIAVVLISTLLLYIPFLLKFFIPGIVPKPDMSYIYKNYDGLLYIIPAKTWYNIESIRSLHIEQPLDPRYFAAHLPLYPIFIYLFSFMGYVHSMIFVTILSTIALAVAFYLIVKNLKLSDNPFVLTLVFLFLPRFLVLRTVGAPESLFLLCILLSLYFFEKKRYLYAGLMGGLAVLTKTPGILLFVAYFLTLIEQHIKNKKISMANIWILIIPASLAGLFYFYHVRTGDFMAYFHTGGVVPMLYPFAAFNYQAKWVGTAWLEDIVLYLCIYLAAVVQLKDTKYRSFFYFGITFFVATIFVQHRDISRYILPMWLLACIAFERYLTSKKFLIVLILLLPAIYLYAWNFMLFNIMPVSNWAPFL